jgi:hypothetical protein
MQVVPSGQYQRNGVYEERACGHALRLQHLFSVLEGNDIHPQQNKKHRNVKQSKEERNA